MARRRLIAAVAGVGLAAAVALAASPAQGQAQVAGPAPVNTVTTPCGWATGAPPTTYDHVIVIIFENKAWKTVFKLGNAPYLTNLADQCGRGDNMQALSNTSLADYVALTSGLTGSNGEITSNDDPTVWPQSSVSLFEHLGTGAVQLAESQPSNCYMKGSGDFVINHAPYQYYTRINKTLCPTQARPLDDPPTLSARYTLVIPNKCHDMHKCPANPTVAARVKAGDNWASTFVPKLLSSAEYQAGKTVIFITWDEANGRTYQIPFIVISPYTKPLTRVTTLYNHYSMLKSVQQLLGDTPLLGHAGDAGTQSLSASYGLS